MLLLTLPSPQPPWAAPVPPTYPPGFPLEPLLQHGPLPLGQPAPSPVTREEADDIKLTVLTVRYLPVRTIVPAERSDMVPPQDIMVLSPRYKVDVSAPIVNEDDEPTVDEAPSVAV